MSRVASDSPPDRPFESLRSPVRFREVLRRGDRRTVGGITVVSLFVDEPGTRIGLAVGRRLGSAVTRNRIKRRIRHACRHLDLSPGWDHVVIPAPATARAPFSSLVEWLRRATERP
ncbi:MAG: ribonuclease P protein component [Acidimicrobiia bacterium]